jgi:hypothetical protein
MRLLTSTTAQIFPAKAARLTTSTTGKQTRDGVAAEHDG